MDQYQRNIVIGCMAFLVTKHLAPDIGHVGMEQPLNNYALAVYCTMKTLTVVTGLRMLTDVKSIVKQN